MKLFSRIVTLCVLSFAVGCNSSEPVVHASPASSATPTSGEVDLSSGQEPDGDASDDPAADIEAVQADVRATMNAVYGANVETLLEYTHPKIIEMMGGKAQATKVLEAALSQTTAMGLTLESLKFPEDPTFLKTEANHFAIVPTMSIMSANGQRVESLNYQLGVKAVGTSKWTYIEGSRINKQNVGTLFPDFPSDYEFPEFYRKKL